MTMRRNRSTWDLKEDKVSTSILEARLARGGSAETELRNTPAEVVAMIPATRRVPDAVTGSTYGEIADGRMSLARGLATMDGRCVVHSAYAEAWLRHVWLEEHGYDRELVAWAERHDIVERDIHVRDREYDRLVDVLDEPHAAIVNA